MESGMARLGKQLSAGTQQLASQAAVVAQVAKKSLTAGFKTCEENSGGTLHQFEVRINRALHSRCLLNYPDLLHDLGSESVPTFRSKFPTSRINGISCSSLSGDPSLPKDCIRVWGSTSFDFHVELVSHGLLSKRLVATGTRTLKSDLSGRAGTVEPVPIKCQWKRRLVDHLSDIPDASGTQYPITADDVMSYILIEAYAEGEAEEGTFTYAVTIVNVMSCQTMRMLNVVHLNWTHPFVPFSRSCTATVYPPVFHLVVQLLATPASFRHNTIPQHKSLPSDDSPHLASVSWIHHVSDHGNDNCSEQQSPEYPSNEHEEELILHLNTECLKIVKPGHKNLGSQREWYCAFGSLYPRVILNKTNLTEFQLHLSTSECLTLTTPTHTQRDILALAIRCFHARRWTANSLLLQHATFAANFPEEHVYQTSREFPAGCLRLPPADSLSVIHRLNAALYGCLELQQKFSRERDKIQLEKDLLEEDIASTLVAYQQLLTQGYRQSRSPFLSDSLSSNPTVETQETHSSRVSEDTALRPHSSVIDEFDSTAPSSSLVIQQELTSPIANDDFGKCTTDLTNLQANYQQLQTFLLKNNRLESPHTTCDNVCKKSSASPLENRELSDEWETMKMQNIALSQENKKLLSIVTKLNKKLSNQHASSTKPSTPVESDNAFSHAKDQMLEKQLHDLTIENKKLSEAVDSLNHMLSVQEAASEKEKILQLENEVMETRRDLETALTERNRHMKQNNVLCKDLEKVQLLYEAKVSAFASFSKTVLAEKESLEQSFREALAHAVKERDQTMAEAAQAKEDVAREKALMEKKNSEYSKLEKTNQLLHSRLQKLGGGLPHKTTEET